MAPGTYRMHARYHKYIHAEGCPPLCKAIRNRSGLKLVIELEELAC